MSTSAMFVTFTDLIHNRKVRLQVSQIVGYSSHHDQLNGETVTALFTNHHDLAVIFVRQSPEQIDQLLGESYITVKSEQ